MLKNFTKEEFSGQNDDSNRNLKEFYSCCIMGDSRWDVFKHWILRQVKTGMHVAMTTEKRTLVIKKNIFQEIIINVVYVNAENKKLKEHIPLKLQQF